MQNIIVWLDGKKMVIAGCVAVVVSYLAGVGAIDANLAAMILAIINIVFGGVKVISDKAMADATSSLGSALRNKAK